MKTNKNTNPTEGVSTETSVNEIEGIDPKRIEEVKEKLKDKYYTEVINVDELLTYVKDGKYCDEWWDFHSSMLNQFQEKNDVFDWIERFNLLDDIEEMVDDRITYQLIDPQVHFVLDELNIEKEEG